MTLEFKVESPDGATSVTSQDVASAFQARGYQQATLSPDGQTLHLVDASGGTAEVNIPEFVGAKAKVQAIAPIQGLIDQSMVDAGLRANVSALGNHDDLKRMYLQGQLRDKGIKDANVIGSGSDFYFFNPETGKYHALTNKAGADLSDLAGLGVGAAEKVLGIGGSIAGGLAGTATGAAAGSALPVAGTALGAILGGAAGSAGGGSAGRALFDKIAGEVSPGLAPYIYSEEVQGDRLREAAFDALGGGLGAGLGAIAPKLMSRGLASTAVSKAGGAVEKVGDVIGKGAGYLASEETIPKLARAAAEGFVPVTGQLQLPALAARAGELIPLGLKGLNKAANYGYGKVESEGLKQSLDKLAQWSALKGLAREEAPEWGARMAAKLQGAAAPTAGVREAGIKDALVNLTQKTPFQKITPGLGDALTLASKGGRAVEAFNAAAVKAPIKATELVAKEAALLGNIAKNAGRAAAPLENQALLRQGGSWASEETDGIWDKMTRRPRRQQPAWGN